MTGESEQDPWPWPEALDAMTAAPGFHTVLFEDDRVRVLDGRVAPGSTVPVHTHRWGGVLYILRRRATSSDVIPTGTCSPTREKSNSRPVVGTATWGGPLTPHSWRMWAARSSTRSPWSPKTGSGPTRLTGRRAARWRPPSSVLPGRLRESGSPARVRWRFGRRRPRTRPASQQALGVDAVRHTSGSGALMIRRTSIRWRMGSPPWPGAAEISAAISTARSAESTSTIR